MPRAPRCLGGNVKTGIRTIELTKRFRKATILRRLAFDVAPGSITLLCGRNGAGKTTWIRTALGFTRPEAGRVLFDGNPVEAVRRSVGVVVDEPPVYPRLTGAENLRQLSGIRRPDAAFRATVQKMLGLDASFLGMRAAEYSLGQRRRLAVAAALIRRPAYLFLDEPTIGLDPIAWNQTRACLERMRSEGTAVVLTGQDFTELERLFDHVVVLDGGTAVFDGTAEQFLNRRPPRVRVEASDPGPVIERFPSAVVVSQNGRFVLDIPCADEVEAEAVVAAITRMRLAVRGVSIMSDTLGEAFVALVGESGFEPGAGSEWR
jgi:ABC-2 type transport system ATP-binding protein